MKKILGIGNALVDILIRLDDDRILSGLNLPKGGMELVNRERSDEILDFLKDVPHTLAAGGSAANTIHGLGMLGVSAGYIGTIGYDELGHSFERNMRAAGITPYLFRSHAETGRAITLITPDSERTFATYLGAAVELSANDLVNHEAFGNDSQRSGIFSSYGYLHVEGYLVQNHELIRTAMERAKANGMLVSLDLASYNVVEAHLGFLEEIIRKYVDILFANEEEAFAFTGHEPEEAVHHLGRFCEVAVVKTGEKGSLVKSREVISEIGILPVHPVDTTGAGDLYAAGFLYGHSHGWSLQRCGEAGTMLAGNIIEELGAKMPAGRWKSIRKRLKGDFVRF